jgi:ribose transport system substrate-binding protein
LKRLGTISTVGIAGLAGCTGGSGGGDSGGSEDATETTDSGGASDTTESEDTTTSGDDSYHIGLSVMWAGVSWWTAFIKGGEWYAQDNGHQMTVVNAEQSASKQNQDISRLISQGVDAIIVMPVDSNALATAVDEAAENDVPLFTSNATINSDNVTRYLSFGNRDAAAKAGENLVSRLEEQNGEPRGRVLAGYDSQSYQLGVARREGFENVIAEYDDIEIVGTFASGEGASNAFENFNNLLQANPDVDAIYGANQPKMTGALRALEQRDRKIPMGEEGHVVMCGIDAGPAITGDIADGYIDLIIDQPTQYYNALIVQMIIDYLDAGKDESVLPAMDETVTTEDIQLEGDQHVGVDPWAEPVWADADVVPYEHEGETLHPFVKTNSLVVDSETVDAPYLWGNWVDEV